MFLSTGASKCNMAIAIPAEFTVAFRMICLLCLCVHCVQKRVTELMALTFSNKNSSGDEIANVNFYAVRPEATRIR